MARPLLPPRDASAFTRMTNPQLPPPAIPEIPLHGLAWGGMVTPPLRMQELTALTGKRRVMFVCHMSQLRHIHALSWRSTGPGTIIVAFTFEPSEKSSRIPAPLRFPGSRIPDSGNPEYGIRPSLSLNPLNDSDHSLNQERDNESDIKDLGIKKEVFKREGDFKFQESGIIPEIRNQSVCRLLSTRSHLP
jgi:hypothetical protein